MPWIDAGALKEKYADQLSVQRVFGYDAGFVAGILAALEMPTLSPPNEPLTLDELREMDGEPVWFDTIKRWGIVKVCRDGVFITTKSGEFEVDRCKYCRRPPEGGEDNQ